ncbi:MAG: NAD(P)H-hydrate dehydratase [Lachnospiraceae bacterium]|nr:NAD(P)H-hydrate dehydratase [Lachnospiraceae bacterium]
MDYLVTQEEMRAYDIYTIEHIGIPALVLMERAALAVARRVECALQDRKGKVLCVCGSGNNGGDGLALARLLLDKGIAVQTVFLGERDRASKETACQLSILQKYEVTLLNEIPHEEYAVVVDAIFGTGLSREVTGIFLKAIETINELGAYTISVDIPSGLDGDTGKVLGAAVEADETVTLAFAKRGLYLYPGPYYAGKIQVADIGITRKSFNGRIPGMYTRKDAPAMLWPKRRPDGNKGTFGKLLLAAGSEGMTGAALLAGESAYRAGAGMVKLVVPESIKGTVQEKLPEALLLSYSKSMGLADKEETAFLESCEWANTLAVGPGLSVCESGRRLLELALQTTKPLLIDADGLNILAKDESLKQILKRRQGRTILTPHMGELARLLGKSLAEITDTEAESTYRAAEEFRCIVVGKSARSYVCEPGGAMFLNIAGNDKLATAGSGDTLFGILAALTAQGMDMRDAAEAGVYLHACAGDVAAKMAKGAGITASDIIKSLSVL